MTSKENICDTDLSATTKLKNSTKERVCKTVSEPPAHHLDIEDLLSNPSDSKDKSNLDVLTQHILLEGRLTEQAARRIIETVFNSYQLCLSTKLNYLLIYHLYIEINYF
ncbi:unnamed protein product [Rotaria sp. Silwood1]|nr:unnamed protein product [Rotaria sp. Silwood1]CAF1649175.1 unnamed protein product [Rotaria sp. Silwood1]CAF4951274.1 unnamed protein product [Rotaria sp. Silwood1]